MYFPFLLLGFPHLSICSTHTPHPPIDFFIIFYYFLTIIEIGSYLYQLSKHDPFFIAKHTLWEIYLKFPYFADTTDTTEKKGYGVWQEA
jgi:hypothetical protein